MSWLYSLALVEAFSEADSSDGEPSAPSSGSPIPQAYSSPDRTTVASRLSRYGMTCEPLTASRGEDLLTWFRAGFPARASASQERALESTEPAAECGPRWRGSLAKYDPDTSSWRTAQLSLLGDLDESSVTWPRSGSMRSGVCWERTTLERPTSVSESGLWPTPTVCGNYNRKGASATSGDGLATAVRMGGTQGDCLPQQVGGPLNPPWVEWLMGWPIGWTDLKPSAMGRFQEWQRQHSGL